MSTATGGVSRAQVAINDQYVICVIALLCTMTLSNRQAEVRTSTSLTMLNQRITGVQLSEVLKKYPSLEFLYLGESLAHMGEPELKATLQIIAQNTSHLRQLNLSRLRCSIDLLMEEFRQIFDSNKNLRTLILGRKCELERTVLIDPSKEL